MQNLSLLSEQEASRVIGITRGELKRHTQQRTFGLKPRHCQRGECYYTAAAIQDFRRHYSAQQSAESLFH